MCFKYFLFYNCNVTDLRCSNIIIINTEYYIKIQFLYDRALKVNTNAIRWAGKKMSLKSLSSFENV